MSKWRRDDDPVGWFTPGSPARLKQTVPTKLSYSGRRVVVEFVEPYLMTTGDALMLTMTIKQTESGESYVAVATCDFVEG